MQMAVIDLARHCLTLLMPLPQSLVRALTPLLV